MEDLISVIIPVYNVEQYLVKCLDTVLNQTYSNIEILLIDDESTDSSGAICDSYLNIDSRVKVIHKKNNGLGIARNTGIECASGKYIVFIDSDDFVEKDYIEKAYTKIKNENADICYIDYCEYYTDAFNVPRRCVFGGKTFSEEDIISVVMMNMIGTEPQEKRDFLLPTSSCFSMYSADIIRKYNIRFPSERKYISEDMIFNIEFLKKIKKATFLGKIKYYYRCNNVTSLTHTYNVDDFEKNIILVKKINEILGDLNLSIDIDYKVRTGRLLLSRLRTSVQKAIMYAEHHKDFNLYKHVKSLVYNDEVQSVIKCYPYHLNPRKQRIYNFFIKKRLISGIILLTWINRLGKERRY